MTHRILIALAFIGACSFACQAQNCSTGKYQLTSEFYNQPACSNPASTISDTKTYAEWCTTTYGNSSPGTTYWNATSTVTGYGQNYCAFGTTTSTCKPYMYFYETDGGTSGSDYYYNRFYNQAYDYYVATGNYCKASGAWRQDFKQCATAPCDAVSGGGGCCACNPPPPKSAKGKQTNNNGFAVLKVQTTCCNCSPILIDVSGNGFILTSAASGVSFDISGTGQPIQMAWTAPGVANAFLCLPDSNGRCDDGKDLFGNSTPQPASTTPNGFAALAVYDQPANGGNGDGIIDSRDAIFSSLRLWIDTNHDGISQPEEIYTLPSLGVNSISLAYKLDQRTDQYGNAFRYRAQVNPGAAPGGGRVAYDVFFSTLNQLGSAVLTASKCSGPTATKEGLLPTGRK